MPVLTVRLPDKLYFRLKSLAEKTRRTKSSFIIELMEEYLEDYEEGYTALERLNQKNARYLSTEEVEEELGL